ncbi:MAG: hypothetical protein WB711_13025 [Terriglobales bacterium]
MLEIPAAGSILGKLFDLVCGQTEKTRSAAIALSEATWDFQRAVWLFASVHLQDGVARAARDVAEEERRAVEQMETAYRGFTHDYDWPAKLSALVKKEIGNIDRVTLNLKAFSMTEQGDELEKAAQEIQAACERIRAAAKPYAYGFWRRLGQSRT